jgi:hypothetical protein
MNEQKPLWAALGTGIITSTVFNPFDHALFLSMTQNKKFWLKENFVHPFKGYHQSIFHRVLSSGTYFLFQNEIQSHFALTPVKSGACVGALNAVVGHLLSSVKLTMWARGGNKHTFLSTVRYMLHTPESYRMFFRAMHFTMIRDVKFAMMYETGRQWKHNDFMWNFLFAGSAAVLVSPWNYVKVKRFSCEDSTMNIFKELIQGPKMFQKLQPVVGFFRAGAGMALGQWVFDFLMK